MKRLLIIFLLTVCFPCFGVAQDGPYIVYGTAGGVELITFDKDLNKHSQRISNRNSVDVITVFTQEGDYAFSFKLRDTIVVPPIRYEMPERMVVISDPHGDIVPFVTVLQGAGVIDSELHWRFGCGHLAILGDVSDRGDDVTAIYWLIYKLEEQAREAGGVVHLLLGNHEVMIAQNDLRYLAPKYKTVAENAGVEYSTFWSAQTELGRWIRSRNQIERIGDMLFVHAGISPQIAATDFTVEQINDTVRKYIALERNATANSPMAELIMRTEGPLWYRGMIQPNEEIDDAVVDGILERFGVKKMIVGHTMLREVSEYFGGRVIDVNVDNKRNMERATSRGMMITPDDIWVIDGNGNRLTFAKP